MRSNNISFPSIRGIIIIVSEEEKSSLRFPPRYFSPCSLRRDLLFSVECKPRPSFRGIRMKFFIPRSNVETFDLQFRVECAKSRVWSRNPERDALFHASVVIIAQLQGVFGQN